MQPLLTEKRPGHARCITCHSTGTAFRLIRLPPGRDAYTEEESRKNFEAASRMVVAGVPLKSRLLTMPLAHEAGGTEFHPGGKHWDSQDDPEWKALAAWVSGTHERRFRYYLRVRYIECDAQKVVFNSRYSEYVDVSINEFLRAIGVCRVPRGRLDFQLVKQTVEWKAPARLIRCWSCRSRLRLGTPRSPSDDVPDCRRRAGLSLWKRSTCSSTRTLTKLRCPIAAAALGRSAGQGTDHAAFL